MSPIINKDTGLGTDYLRRNRMRFRPCIDIHNGKVKQIVGGSLTDSGDLARENFVSELSAADYARLYEAYGFTGGHVILLNGKDSPYYEATRQEALSAVSSVPGLLEVGGGIGTDNAESYLAAGASHVIVTSFVFRDGRIDYSRLRDLSEKVGRNRLVLDLSCRERDGSFYVVTDRWQKFTSEKFSVELMEKLSVYCDEFLVHAVDVEGKKNGISEEVLSVLGSYSERPVTYAGGIHSVEDIETIRFLGKEHVDFTIGSALAIFGGSIELSELKERCS